MSGCQSRGKNVVTNLPDPVTRLSATVSTNRIVRLFLPRLYCTGIAGGRRLNLGRKDGNLLKENLDESCKLDKADTKGEHPRLLSFGTGFYGLGFGGYIGA